jgi:hypothetical protein
METDKWKHNMLRLAEFKCAAYVYLDEHMIQINLLTED